MRVVAVILIILSLCGCAAPTAVEAGPAPISEPPETQVSEPEPEPEPEPEEPAVLTFKVVPGLTPEETLEIYLNQLYRSYVEMKPLDLSPVANFEHGRMMQNLQSWNDLLALRRRVIFEHDFCFVDTERKPYSINYIKEKELSDSE